MAEWARWVQQLLSMKERVEDLIVGLRRVETKLDSFIERLARLEQAHLDLRENVKNQILADLKADVVGTNARLDVELRQLRMQLREDLFTSLRDEVVSSRGQLATPQREDIES